MDKKIQEYNNCIDFINIWLKGMWSIIPILTGINILMIKVNPTTTLIPITLLIGGTSLATPYMIITKKIFKQKLNKLNQIKIIRTKYQNYNNNLNKTNHKILTNTNTSKKNNYQYQNKSLNITPKTNHLNIKKKILK